MSNDLILGRNKTCVVPAMALVENKNTNALIEYPRVEYVPVRYEEATVQDLTRASLIVRKCLRRASDCPDVPLVGLQGPAGESGDALYESTCGSTEAHRDLELLMYEIAATTGDDEIALDKALDMLICGNPVQKDIERAVEIIEHYFTSEVTKTSSAGLIASLYKPFQKKSWVQKIEAQYKALMAGTCFDPMVAISYAGLLRCHILHPVKDRVRNRGRCQSVSAMAIVQSTYARNIIQTFELTKSLVMLIAGDDEEEFALCCAMYSNSIEHFTKMPNRNESIVICWACRR